MKSNHSLFSLATTSTQNSYFEIQSFSLSIRNYFYAKFLSFFSPWAHKCIVASAPVNNVSSFSSNSDNSLVSRAFLAIFEANSDSKSNLVLKSHVLLVSAKPAAPMSVSNFCAHFQILVMLWFKKPVLILTHLILVLSQIQLPNVLFVTQKFSGPNAQTLIIHLSFCNRSQ